MAAKRKDRRGGRRVGAGRKPKPPEEKQGHKVGASLTETEYAQLQKAAGDEPLGVYVRRVLLRHLARRRK